MAPVGEKALYHRTDAETGCLNSLNSTTYKSQLNAGRDKGHDQKMGLRSTAILLEKNTKLWLLGFSTLCTSNLALFGWLTSQEPIFYITGNLNFIKFVRI